MATTLYLLERDDGLGCCHRGTADTRLDGNNPGGWNVRMAHTSAGSGGTISVTRSTQTGPVAGLEYLDLGQAVTMEWLSDPLAADITISGTITHNLWMSESSMNANAGAQCVIERVDENGAIVSTISNSERGTEMGTSAAAQNWTNASPTSTDMLKGDRIRIRVLINDAATMVTGFTCTFIYNGATGGASGDSFVTFTENLTFTTSATLTTKMWFSNTASDIVDQGIVEKEMWTTQGASVQTAVRNSVAGFTAPLQWTDTAGGTAIEWYTKRLEAATLAGAASCIIRCAESNSLANMGAQVEVAVVDNDGTNVVIWGTSGLLSGASTQGSGEMGTSESGMQSYVYGQDLAIAAGQRIRVRVYLDDSSLVMGTGRTGTFWYDGAAGATGDSFIYFPATLTEFVDVVAPPRYGFVDHSNPGIL